MTAKTRTIELDEATASVLESCAAERGLSVSEFVAGMTALQASSFTLSPADEDDLDRQWAAIKAGEPTIPHEDVARWLQTWGTSAFKPWPR
jgi:predicted transcriptional regulator